jgi:hypothetical protein
MHEYDIYLPTRRTDGREVNESVIQEIKHKLAQTFGGYTQMTQRCEGVWKYDGVIFRDEIMIIRVLDSGQCNLDMAGFRKMLETTLNQERILIVDREVKLL